MLRQHLQTGEVERRMLLTGALTSGHRGGTLRRPHIRIDDGPLHRFAGIVRRRFRPHTVVFESRKQDGWDSMGDDRSRDSTCAKVMAQERAHTGLFLPLWSRLHTKANGCLMQYLRSTGTRPGGRLNCDGSS